MEASERRVGMDPETRRRLAVLGGAALITAVSFALIFVLFAWLPFPLFALWMRMNHEARVIAAAVFYLSMLSLLMGSTMKRRQLRKLRSRR